MRDVDCDFRLMRRSIFERIRLEKNSGVICLELMKKIHDAGFRIAEVPVHHYHRAYGRSQFFNFRRIFKTGIDVLKLWHELVIRREHQRAPQVAAKAARSAGRRARTAPASAAVMTADYQSFYRGRRVMITGGLGFIGTNLARQLVALGADVLLVDSLIPDYGGNLFNIDGLDERAARQHRRRAAAEHDELPRARSRGHLQPRRPGEPHRQHAGSVSRISRSTAAAS